MLAIRCCVQIGADWCLQPEGVSGLGLIGACNSALCPNWGFRQAIGIFQETSVGLTHNPGIFFVPIATYLLLFAFIAVWAYFTAYMYTMQEAYEDNDTGYVSYRWADSQENENVTTISDFQGKPTESEFEFFLVCLMSTLTLPSNARGPVWLIHA